MSETWAWISGWGIQPERFKAAAERALPNVTHHVFAPEPEAVDAALSCGAIHFGGYSLGSLLLMSTVDRIDRSCKMTCLAPIPAFCKESELGGVTTKAILQSLQTRLARKPEAALKLFYRLAQLENEPNDTLPYSVESLIWGLDRLAAQSVHEAAFERVHAVIADTDALMDANKLRSLFPHHTSTTCGHDYNALLPVLAKLQ